MENFIIKGLTAGIKKKGKGAGIKRVAEIHLADKDTDDNFYISLAIEDNKVSIYDTDNPTYHIQVEDGKEIACEDFDEIMQFCCTVETTKEIIIESPNSVWGNLYRFLLKATEVTFPENLVNPYIGGSVCNLPYAK